MSPQFVDLDADGHLDILAGSFGGAPYVARGGERGFAQPELLRDAKGERLALNMYWDHDEGHWVWTKAFDAPGTPAPEGQGTSAIALDWDADGDLDLLLGDYKTGRIYRRTNEGSAREPRYSCVNVPVAAGAEPLVVPGHVATLRPLDWDGDGLLDLLVGSMGEKEGSGGGVYLYRNLGQRAEPRFGAPLVLVEPGGRGATEATRPNEGLYPEAADLDGDGDLDLLVGGASLWQVPERELGEKERERLAEFEERRAAVRAELNRLRAEITSAMEGLGEREAAARKAELERERAPKLRALTVQRAELEMQIEPLSPGTKERHFVWWYRNDAPTAR